MRRNNLWGGLAVLQTVGPSGHTNSPHPSSREGHHSTARRSSSFPPIAFDPARPLRRCNLPGPPELGAVNPDAVHDHRQPTRQRHDRLFHPAMPGDLHRPGLEPGPLCFAQIVFLILGIVASIKLILQTREKADTGMFLGCMGLSSCCLAFLQIALFWVGIGSNYAIAKHMFVTVAFFIFVVSANIALKKSSPSDLEQFGVTKGLAWCSILALLTMRVDLYPSVLDLKKVVAFQTAVRTLSTHLGNEGGRRPIAIAKQWPPNISYEISIGDLRFPMKVADLILEDRPLPQDQVSIAFMPPDDPGVIPECSVPAHSNQDAEAFDYSCVVRSANTRR